MEKWWKKSVVYQIYPRSFQDSNRDGIGDINGIIKRLDYLENLGIDVIWLSPVYQSPNDDNGYDISNYKKIMKEFGTMAEVEELIFQAKKHDINIIFDLVLNHTSDEHEWFIESRNNPESKYRDYYIWRDPVQGHVPNGLVSDFGGSAWEYDGKSQQYYLHLFSKKQPDLNWENPNMRFDLYQMINFWIDKGVSGFRLDMIELIGKQPNKLIKANGPYLHDYIKEMNQQTFGKKDLLTVGETWQANTDNAQLYSNPDGSEFSMIFQFEHIKLDKIKGMQKWDYIPLEVPKLKEVLSKWQYALEGKGWNSLFWNNHDLPRIVSRWGNDKEYRVESAKMLATLLHGLKGTPYIYQGEEIGMTNVNWSSIENYRDIETRNMYKEREADGYSKESIMDSIHAHSRDNARTPMQWDSSLYAGFSTVEPWIQVNDNYLQINVKQSLEDSNSIFYHYKKLIQLRKESRIIREGAYELLDSKDNVFAYLRKFATEELLIVCNFSEEDEEFSYECPNELIEKEFLITNYNEPVADELSFKLRPYEANIIYLKYKN